MAIFDKKFDSAKQEWTTPDNLYSLLDNEFKFELDLAADKLNSKCLNYYDENIDSLKQEWKGICWLNPPYGNKKYKLVDWIKKAYSESQKDNCTVVMLIPARTNTNWWHDYCMKSCEVRFICGRPKFGNAIHGLPQPLALVVFKKTVEKTVFSTFFFPESSLMNTAEKNRQVVEYTNKYIKSNQRITYSSNSDLELSTVLNLRQICCDKPYGIWYSFGNKWLRFLYGSFYNNKITDEFSAFSHDYITKISDIYSIKIDKSKILIINDKIQLKKFARKYQISPDLVDWTNVGKEYCGIEINVPKSKYSWHQTWDVPSGCIWNKKGITKIKLLKRWKLEWT